MKSNSLLLCFLLSLLFFTQASATHVMGSDITWECLGNNQYKVMLNVYRDCNGVNISNTQINFKGNCAGITKSSQVMTSGVDITPVCSSVKSRCADKNSSFAYGLEKYTITTTIDVTTFKSNGCCDVNISWSQCCRNGAITTGAGNQNYYVEATMNVCQNSCASGPVFNSEPLSFLCIGRDAYLDYSVSGRDTSSNGTPLDSFKYSFTYPNQSANTKTSWQSPYSFDKPLSYLGFPKDYAISRFPFGFHLDSNVGILAFRPMKPEVTIISIKVEQYRSGKKISETIRDVQIYVTKCANNQPPTLKITRSNQPIIGNKIRICPGEPLCLKVETNDLDSLDTTSLKAKFTIPGAKFTYTQNGRFAEAQFCWTPKAQHVSPNPYYLGIEAKDKGCPSPGVVNQGFIIEVGNPKVTVGNNISACANGQKIRLKAAPLGGNWSSTKVGIDSSGYYLIADKNSTGLQSHIYTVNDSFGCSGSDTLSVHIKPVPEISFNTDTVVCRDPGDTLEIEVSPNYGTWSDNDIKGDSNRFYLIVTSNMIGKTRDLTYTATNIDGCSSQNTLSLNILKDITVFAGNYDTICIKPSGRNYILNGTPKGGIWSGPGVNASGSQSYSTLSSQMFTSFPQEFIYSYSDSNGCNGIDTFMLLVKEMPASGFSADITSGPSPLKVSFTNTSSISASKYDWDFGDGKTSKQKSPKHTFSKDGNYTVSLTTYSQDSLCDSTFTMLIKVGSNIGIDDAQEASLLIYPNPSQGIISVENTKMKTELTIYSPIGQIVKSITLESGLQQLDLSNLPKGIYRYQTSLNESGTFLIE